VEFFWHANSGKIYRIKNKIYQRVDLTLAFKTIFHTSCFARILTGTYVPEKNSEVFV
jgi:hypothetical protein